MTRATAWDPSFSSKNGVRYRFYVSAPLRGRKGNAGSVPRVSAPEIENIVVGALRKQLPEEDISRETVADRVERVTVKRSCVEIAFAAGELSGDSIAIPWTRSMPNGTQVAPTTSDRKPDQKLLQSVVRAHLWLKELCSGRYTSVEDLAVATCLHPKVVRQGLRLAFLAPEITSTILEGKQPEKLSLGTIPKLLSLHWNEQTKMLS